MFRYYFYLLLLVTNPMHGRSLDAKALNLTKDFAYAPIQSLEVLVSKPVPGNCSLLIDLESFIKPTFVDQYNPRMGFKNIRTLIQISKEFNYAIFV